MRFPLSSALCTALAMVLAGCTPSPPTAADRSAGEEARPSTNADSDERPQAGQGSVTIAGEDAAEDVQ
ncbi:MAG TPA: serine/threonine kinase, partial [Pseudomonas sp.]|nr:serine/threonine kinase [Pseudomonas sp.]